MANYDFRKDIIEGEEGEMVVLKDLESMGAEFISDNKDNKYDLKISKSGKEITYEIKTDVYCKPDSDTGNMFIEFECRGKDSGIRVSQATWFVTYYKHLNELWYIKTEDLLNLVENEPIRMTNNSGDAGSNTRGYLLPRYQYKSHFKVRTING
jgi:hypothetical protein